MPINRRPSTIIFFVLLSFTLWGLLGTILIQSPAGFYGTTYTNDFSTDPLGVTWTNIQNTERYQDAGDDFLDDIANKTFTWAKYDDGNMDYKDQVALWWARGMGATAEYTGAMVRFDETTTWTSSVPTGFSINVRGNDTIEVYNFAGTTRGDPVCTYSCFTATADNYCAGATIEGSDEDIVVRVWQFPSGHPTNNCPANKYEPSTWGQCTCGFAENGVATGCVFDQSTNCDFPATEASSGTGLGTYIYDTEQASKHVNGIMEVWHTDCNDQSCG
jgi:hypothetical protein